MIPKIIHLCWLSGTPYPEPIQRCIDSWHEHLPDYEIWLWDTTRFNVMDTPWTKQAFECKKYAFAADYIRLYALYHHGGIYLDSDVLVYKSFNDLLHLPYFIGEDNVHCFEPAIIGAEPHQAWIKQVLNRYEGLEFINNNGEFNMKTLPVVFREQLHNYLICRASKAEQVISLNNQLFVLPSNYFHSRDYVGAIKTRDSYCSHNFIGSWLPERDSGKNPFKKILPRFLLNFAYRFYYLIPQNRKYLRTVQINYHNC